MYINIMERIGGVSTRPWLSSNLAHRKGAIAVNGTPMLQEIVQAPRNEKGRQEKKKGGGEKGRNKEKYESRCKNQARAKQVR